MPMICQFQMHMNKNDNWNRKIVLLTDLHLLRDNPPGRDMKKKITHQLIEY